MTKTRIPFFSFGAKGTVADTLTAQKRGKATLIRSKPTPTDPNTLAQHYQRWDYQDYVAWWHDLTAAQREAYRSAATKLRLTIFQYWIKYNLSNLPDLAGRWRLDTLADNIARDSSRYENNGVVYGATLVAGVIDHAFHFDGIDDRILISTFDRSFTAMTVLYFANLRPHAEMPVNSRGILHWWHYWAPYGIYIYKTVNANTITTRIKNTTGVGIVTPLTFTPNQWFLTGFVWDGTNFRTIMNTTLGPPIAFTGTVAAPKPLHIACFSGTSYFLKGELDNILIYDRVLTQTDINRHAERRYP